MPRCIILISHLPPLVCCSKSHESTQFPPRLQSTLRRIRNSCLSGRLIRSIDLRLRRISEAVRADGRHRSPPPPHHVYGVKCVVEPYRRRLATPPGLPAQLVSCALAGGGVGWRRVPGYEEGEWVSGCCGLSPGPWRSLGGFRRCRPFLCHREAGAA